MPSSGEISQSRGPSQTSYVCTQQMRPCPHLGYGKHNLCCVFITAEKHLDDLGVIYGGAKVITHILASISGINHNNVFKLL